MTCIVPSGEHDSFLSDRGWECANCERSLIQCDYCTVCELNELGVPDGWLSMRMREKPPVEGEMTRLVKGPTACPYHYNYLKMLS